jgi:hypothetical protein
MVMTNPRRANRSATPHGTSFDYISLAVLVAGAAALVLVTIGVFRGETNPLILLGPLLLLAWTAISLRHR